MMMRVDLRTCYLAAAAILVMTAVAQAEFEITPSIQAELDRQKRVVAGWAADAVIVKAVVEQNTKGPVVGMDNVKWKVLRRSDPLVRAFQSNAAGQFLRTKMEGSGGLITEYAGDLGMWAISRVNTAFQVVATQSLPAMNDLLQAERDMQQALVAERSLMFMSLATPEMKQHVKVHAGELAQVLERWREYTAIPASDAERGLWPAFNAAVREWEQASRDAARVLSEDTPSARRDAIDLSMGEGAVKFENARTLRRELPALRIAQVESHARTEEAPAAAMLGWVVIAVAGAMALALVLSVVLARAIARPLGQTVTLLRDIAEGEGDLTQRLEVRSRDELGELARWFNIFVDKLRVIIGQTRESAE